MVELFFTGYVNSTLSAITGFNKLYDGFFQQLSMLLQSYYNAIPVFWENRCHSVKIIYQMLRYEIEKPKEGAFESH